MPAPLTQLTNRCGSPVGTGRASRPRLARLAAWLLAHRGAVLAVWLALLPAAAALLQPTQDALKSEMAVPGREAFEANTRIAALYGNGGRTAPLVAVLTLPRGKTVDAPGVREELARALARIEREVPGVRVASSVSTGEHGFVSEDRRTAFALVFSAPGPGVHAPPAATEAVRRILAGVRIGGASLAVSGLEAQQEGPARAGLGALGGGMVSGLAALVVLLIAFRSALALLPMLMAFVSIIGSMALLWPVTRLADVSNLVPYLVVLIGLAISVDYALLLVTRWREERQAGQDNEEAVIRSVATAGGAVLVSGVTFASGLLALVVLPVPLFRSIGYAGVLIPLVGVAVQLTLLPIALASIGPTLDRLRLPWGGGAAESGERWARLASLVVRRPLAAAVAALGLLALLIAPLFSLDVGIPAAEALASRGEARTGLRQLVDSGIGAGAVAPIEIVTTSRQAQALAEHIEAIPGMRAALAPGGPGWRRAGTAIVLAVPRSDTNSPEGRRVLAAVRERAHETPGALVGGPSAESAELVSAIYRSFPLMLALILLVTLVVLARAFRSLVLPLKAILLNVLSVAAALGAVVLVWQEGYGSELLWHVPASGSVTEFIPLMTFAFLFGISMDYEVFILSRMREEYDRCGTTEQAVVQGMRRTGRLVTLAGLILMFAFVSMAASPDTNLNMFASGLAFGILIDATLIRVVLVPALVTLIGRWNWWLPRWAGQALRVSPTPDPRPLGAGRAADVRNAPPHRREESGRD